MNSTFEERFEEWFYNELDLDWDTNSIRYKRTKNRAKEFIMSEKDISRKSGPAIDN